MADMPTKVPSMDVQCRRKVPSIPSKVPSINYGNFHQDVPSLVAANG